MKSDIKQCIVDSLPYLVACADGRVLCYAYCCKFYMSDGSCAYGCKPPGKHMCS